MNKNRNIVNSEFDNFFEFDSNKKTHVTSVSCKLFAEHMMESQQAEITRLNAIIKENDKEMDRLSTICDALLNHCDKDGGECHVCSEIVCKYKDALHFHHDGCPSCYQDEAMRVKGE